MSTDFDDEKDFTVCLANKDFQPGQEFTIFYGVRANIDLLVHNGFVFESNDDDCFTMKLGISKNDPLALDKTNFLEELSINRTGLFFIGKIFGHFWPFITIFWSSTAIFGHILVIIDPCLIFNSHFWSLMAIFSIFAHMWPYFGLFVVIIGHIWPFLVMFGPDF